MRRTRFATDECPVARSVEAVGDWWSLLIVRDAFAGKGRFGEFQTSLGVAKNILTVRLRKLVADGVLELVPASDDSAFKEYALTGRGRGLLPVIVALGQWGCTSSPFKPVDRKTGKRVRLEFRSEGGRKLTPDDVQLVPASGT
ncbi:MAG TPA: helix-turn-helix domain-containing protein [Urbifossiella sp.]|nr:helix-turn-helix domain-containing protein [Urbifossiella sp.]